MNTGSPVDSTDLFATHFPPDSIVRAYKEEILRFARAVAELSPRQYDLSTIPEKQIIP